MNITNKHSLDLKKKKNVLNIYTNGTERSANKLKLNKNKAPMVLSECLLYIYLQYASVSDSTAAVKFDCFLWVRYGAGARLQLWGISTLLKHLRNNELTETQNQSYDPSNQILPRILLPLFLHSV